MIISISGANGYVGTHLIQEAIEMGWETRGIVRRADSADNIKKLGARSFLAGNYDVKPLQKIMQGSDVHVHLVGEHCGDMEKFSAVNVDITRKALEAARNAHVKKFIYFSGLGVGDEKLDNAYFVSKRHAEKAIIESGLDYIIFRPSYIIGDGDSLMALLLESIVEGIIESPGGQGATFQVVHIADVVRAVISVAGNDAIKNKTYDLAGKEQPTLQDVTEKLLVLMRSLDFIIPDLVYFYHEKMEREEGCVHIMDYFTYEMEGNPAAFQSDTGVEFIPLEKAIERAARDILQPDAKTVEKRAVILLSGGLDSATALYWALDKGYEVIGLNVKYPLLFKRGSLNAVELAKAAGIRLIDVQLPFIKDAIGLKIEGYPVPSAVGASLGYVPYRNLVFNAAATYYADILGASTILSGHIASDPLPDAKMPFFEAMERLVEGLKVGKNARAPKFLLPLKDMSKGEVIKLGMKLGVPYKWTWTCVVTEEEACGKCKPCLERTEAFKFAGIEDPALAFNPFKLKNKEEK